MVVQVADHLCDCVHGWASTTVSQQARADSRKAIQRFWLISAVRPGEHAKRASESCRANAAYVGNAYRRMAAGAGGSISLGVWSAADHGRPDPEARRWARLISVGLMRPLALWRRGSPNSGRIAAFPAIWLAP